MSRRQALKAQPLSKAPFVRQEPVFGIQMDDGKIHCQGCLSDIPDSNRKDKGPNPFCPNCQVAVKVRENPFPSRSPVDGPDAGTTPDGDNVGPPAYRSKTPWERYCGMP